MGHMRAMEAATVMTDMIGLERALEYHLTANHFPPVPRDMIEPAKAAITAMVNEEPDTMITLPPGRAVNSVEAQVLTAALHLDAFIEAQMFEDEEE